jgi:RimJ/RimL family protein N-acetyltransferase
VPDKPGRPFRVGVANDRLRLETERLILRKPQLDDAEALVEMIGDAETMRFIGDGSTGGIVAAQRALEKWVARWEANDIGFFMLERREDGRFVGRAGFLVWDPATWTVAELHEGCEVEIGWTIVRSQWGNGYATEAALALRDWTDRRRLISLIQHGNDRSVRVAEKIGERYERDVEVRGIATGLYALER